MQYVILAVASELEAERLRQDLAENPGAPLHTPRWANAVHATLVTSASITAPPATAAAPVAGLAVPRLGERAPAA